MGSHDAKAVAQADKVKGTKSEAWLDMLEQSSPVAASMGSTACVRWMPAVKFLTQRTPATSAEAAAAAKAADTYRDGEWHKLIRAGSPVRQPVPRTAKPKGHRNAEWHKLIRAGSHDAKAVAQAGKVKGTKSEAWLDMLEQSSPVAAST